MEAGEREEGPPEPSAARLLGPGAADPDWTRPATGVGGGGQKEKL